MARETNILDHLLVLVRWRRLVLTSFLVVTVLTAVLSLLMPKAYRAQALVYPPKERQDAFGLSSLLGGSLAMSLLGMGESSVSATDFVPVLKSEKVADSILQRFGLAERYGAETREEALGMVSDRLELELSREQFLSVSYEDETPELAAQITNAFVEELDAALQERRREQAGGLRKYFETRLSQASEEMRATELAYNAFQKKHMLIDLEAQAKSQLESASSMFSTLGELIVKREVAEGLMEPGHPQLEQLDVEIGATRETIERLLMGSPQGSNPTGPGDGGSQLPRIFIPFEQMPQLGLQVMQLRRDVEIKNAIYQFVLQEFEKYRFEEEKATAIVIVLDAARPPDFKSRPRRTLMVLTAGGLSLLISVVLAFVLETMRGLDPENRGKLDAIWSEIGRGRSS